MRNKLIKKLAIVGLAAIFLLSMSSNSPAKKGGKEPSELYKVTMSINDFGPGMETLGLGQSACGSEGYFYAERLKGNFLLGIRSEGSETPGPENDPTGGNLIMWVTAGKVIDPGKVEQCPFSDGCHGETERSPGWILIHILKSYDGEDPEEDIQIHWYLDDTKVASGKKKEQGREWRIYSLPYEELPLVYCTNPVPPNLEGIGDSWETDVIGPFVLHHSGKACDGPEDMYNREVLPDFNIHLTIQRVR